MNTSTFRISIFAAATLLTLGCEAELHVGNPDGSLFDSGAEDASDDDASVDDDAATSDAATHDGATDAGTDGGNVPNVSDVPQLLANAVCQALEDCDGAPLLTTSLGGETCADVTGSVFSARDLTRLADSIADGRIVFDRSRLAACQSAIAAQACNVQTQRRPAVCEEAFDGTVQLGGDCVINEDCSGTSTFCQAQAQCPGKCAVLLISGEDCTNSDQCSDGLQCAVLDGRRQCLAPGTANATCGFTDTPPCKRGFTCTPNVGDDDTCKAYSVVYVRQAGQTCDPDAGSFCERGLSCTNTPTGIICSAPAARDGACFRSHRLQPYHCPTDQWCDAVPGEAGICKDLPVDDQDCLPDTRLQRCAPGYVCLGDSKCHLKGENGDACDDDTQCYSGHCDGTVCAPPAALCSL